MLHKLIIRKAEKSDLAALEWGGEYTHYRNLFADAFQQSIEGRAMIWIAELPPRDLVGQLIISLNSRRIELADGINRAYLYGFRVRPQYRNMGIGSSMLRVVELELSRLGYRQLSLNVSRNNDAGRIFYEHLGYNIIGSEPGEWSYLDHRGQRVYVHDPCWRMIKDLNI